MSDPLENMPTDCVVDWDHRAFEERMDRAKQLRPREGYWSPFSTLGWIASRSEQFLAATQLFEEETYANRGSLFSASAWWTIGNEAGARFGMTLTGASDPLREALESGAILGGVARNFSSGEMEEIKPHQWTDWAVAYKHQGLQLLPGYVDFKWPADAIRSAFPSLEIESESIAPQPSAFSGRGRPTPRQQEAFKFFGLAQQYLKNGSRPLSATDLRAEYNKQFGDGGRLKGKPLNRSTFEEMLGRYHDGWRIDGRRWQMSGGLSD